MKKKSVIRKREALPIMVSDELTLKKREAGIVFHNRGQISLMVPKSTTEGVVPDGVLMAVALANLLREGDENLQRALHGEFDRMIAFTVGMDAGIKANAKPQKLLKAEVPKKRRGRPPKEIAAPKKRRGRPPKKAPADVLGKLPF